MYCENCGTKLNEGDSFCSECGHPKRLEKTHGKDLVLSNYEQKVWFRLAKTIYVLLYAFIPFAVVGMWLSVDPYTKYLKYSDTYSYELYWEAFVLSFLTLIVSLVVLRLGKIAFFYIVFAQKPQWKVEIKKYF